METLVTSDFMLHNETARYLYSEYADINKVPIIDYHCHISPKDIYQDIRYENITRLWLGGDHYKWRQLRTCGIGEEYITGAASDYEKFRSWCSIMPMLIGNPLYHWSHMELKYYFGYEGIINPESCDEIWQRVNGMLANPDFSVRNLIKKSNVKVICTTDDPVDSLEWHQRLKEEGFEVKVLPAWRPDRAMYIEKRDFPEYIAKLSEVSGVGINSFEDLKQALCNRMDYFRENGCCLSDHGLEYVMYEPASEKTIDQIFKKALKGENITRAEELKYKYAFLLFMAHKYEEYDWTMQLHYGVKRDNNRFMFNEIGPDTGFDCISNYTPSSQLTDFLNAVGAEGKLPRTILYSLNPEDNTTIGSVMGCFQGGGIPNRIQHGSAWWFNDHADGIRNQLKALAASSCLGNFIGMLTDSRSFVSYVRHDYFRRLLCDIIGEWVERGEYPYDENALKRIIEGISYKNAEEYFKFK